MEPELAGRLVPKGSQLAPIAALSSAVAPLVIATYFFMPGVASKLEWLNEPAYLITLLSVALGCTAARFGSAGWRVAGLVGAALGAIAVTLLAVYAWMLYPSDLGWDSPVPLSVFLITLVALNWGALFIETVGAWKQAWRAPGVLIGWSSVVWIVANYVLQLVMDRAA